jgi:hypothetical protein
MWKCSIAFTIDRIWLRARRSDFSVSAVLRAAPKASFADSLIDETSYMEKEPLIHAAFGPQISADQRNNVSANQRFLLLVKIA